ncbi:hypothetical protein BD410DRAFT_302722 [Rickenella mellea]|uniref:HSF-type DNA-binding domain-containing protein n=1 Tax=Rickenella mellea TaxID=50990 RepID=A0A4Y7Q222_9AGAM|nr:hypothetical protein BD410DRAFT_302722 [Rickenella mellea]
MNISFLPRPFSQGNNEPLDQLYSPTSDPPALPPPSWFSPTHPGNARVPSLSSNRAKQECVSASSPNSFNDLESLGDMHSRNDFVQKLYRILEDDRLHSVVSWTSKGDAFVVKSVLPRLFRHSNFASFVRQLNKYDFHKVKNSDLPEEHNWIFRHPDFHADRKYALENIKRKTSVRRRHPTITAPQPPFDITAPRASPSSHDKALEDQLVKLERLRQSQDSMASCLRRLEGSYVRAHEDLVNCNQNFAKHGDMMQSMLQHIQHGDQSSLNPAFLSGSYPIPYAMDAQWASSSFHGSTYTRNEGPMEAFNFSNASEAMPIDTGYQCSSNAPLISPEYILPCADDQLFSLNLVQNLPHASSRWPSLATNRPVQRFDDAV